MTRIIPIALLLASCGGQVDDPVTLELTSEGLLVSGAYGEGVVSQEVSASPESSWKLVSDGDLRMEVVDDKEVGSVRVVLTGSDLVVVHRGTWVRNPWDGALLKPERAWVTLGDEVVAREEFE